jgi:hypothetical protein
MKNSDDGILACADGRQKHARLYVMPAGSVVWKVRYVGDELCVENFAISHQTAVFEIVVRLDKFPEALDRLSINASKKKAFDEFIVPN